MKTIIETGLVALALTVGTAAAQAHTIMRFPYKGAPYAVPHEHKGSGNFERRDTLHRLWCAKGIYSMCTKDQNPTRR